MEQVSGALGSSLGGMVPDVTGPAQQAPYENPVSLPVPVPMP